MATTATNVSIRIDKDVKTKADALFSELGISLTSAINIFLRQAIREQKIPFSISLGRTPNKETIAAMLEAERLASDPNVHGYSDVEEALAELKR